MKYYLAFKVEDIRFKHRRCMPVLYNLCCTNFHSWSYTCAHCSSQIRVRPELHTTVRSNIGSNVPTVQWRPFVFSYFLPVLFWKLFWHFATWKFQVSVSSLSRYYLWFNYTGCNGIPRKSTNPRWVWRKLKIFSIQNAINWMFIQFYAFI